MKIDCDIYRNLIPLYIENRLNEPSKAFVEEHLASCPRCQEYLKNCKCPLSNSWLIADKNNELVSQKKSNFKLHLSQWAFLICGIFLSILFTMNDDLLQNIILLPFIGFIGYLLTYQTRSLPIIVSLLLTITIIFKDAMQGSFNHFSGYILYLIIFFFLALSGTLCGCLLKGLSKNFKTQTLSQKVQTISAWSLIGIVCLIILYFANIHNGNPLSACYAQFKMRHYLAVSYPNAAAKLGSAHYNFKNGCYSTKARLITDDTAHPFTLYYRKGKVWDDYFSLYLEDEPNEYRLGKEVSDSIGALLEQHHIPYHQITCSLELTQGIYNDYVFDQNSNLPLSLNIYNLTDTKQTYEEFSLWCEEIRSLLMSQGYSINDLTLESDPHFMANRLALTLTSKDFDKTIEDVKTYKHFTDYGIINYFDEKMTSAEVGYEKIDFYYDKELSSHIAQSLQKRGLDNVYVTAQVNESNELDLSICYFGSRISIDHFAETTHLIMDCLNELHIFDQYKINPLFMKYGWGTSSQSYSYTIYNDQISDYTEDHVIQTLLSQQDRPS